MSPGVAVGRRRARPDRARRGSVAAAQGDRLGRVGLARVVVSTSGGSSAPRWRDRVSPTCRHRPRSRPLDLHAPSSSWSAGGAGDVRRCEPCRAARRAARAWTSATKRSCRTCSPSTSERWSISRTTTRPFTTSSRCRSPSASISAAMAVASRNRVRFDRAGIVRVFCDIHSHMSAFVLVFNHPFHHDDR